MSNDDVFMLINTTTLDNDRTNILYELHLAKDEKELKVIREEIKGNKIIWVSKNKIKCKNTDKIFSNITYLYGCDIVNECKYNNKFTCFYCRKSLNFENWINLYSKDNIRITSGDEFTSYKRKELLWCNLNCLHNYIDEDLSDLENEEELYNKNIRFWSNYGTMISSSLLMQ